MTKQEQSERAEAIAALRATLKPGDTVHTILRNVSRSGMSRRIDVVKLEGGDYHYLTGQVAKAIKCRFPDSGQGLLVGGCGMDMGFHVVYELSHVLFPGGHGCTGEGCGSNDHANGDRSRVVHTGNGADPRVVAEARKTNAPLGDHWHRDGGYALKQRWL